MDWGKIWSDIVNFFKTGGINILWALLILAVGIVIIKLVKVIFKKVLARSKTEQLAKRYLFNAIIFCLYVFLVLIILAEIGIQISGLLAVVAAAGLAIALALQDLLKSITNGMVLLATKPFKENDYVNIDGVYGKVVSVKFFNTTIDTLDNQRIIIPNKNIVDCEIVNDTFYNKRRFCCRFKVAHTTDVTKLQKVVTDAFLSNPEVLTNPVPTLLCQEITEEGTIYEARAWCTSAMPDFERISTTSIHILYNELKRNKIELATKNIIVYNEKRKESFVDARPMFKRDMNVEPELSEVDGEKVVKHKKESNVFLTEEKVKEEENKIEKQKNKKKTVKKKI